MIFSLYCLIAWLVFDLQIHSWGWFWFFAGMGLVLEILSAK